MNLDDLSFESKHESERYRALRAWMQKHSPGWQHVPLERRGGNFLTERWCGPMVAPDLCARGAVVTSEKRGTAFRSLELLHHQMPKVFGLVVDLGRFPETGEVALRFRVSEGGKTIVNDQMEATFLFFGEDNRLRERVSIGQTMKLRVVDTSLSVVSPDPWRETLKKMAASPQSFQAVATKQLDALQARLDEALAKGEIMGFDQGPYMGGGIPPERTERPLTTEERQAEARAAKAEIDRQKAILVKHAAAMHALLVAEVPVELL